MRSFESEESRGISRRQFAAGLAAATAGGLLLNTVTDGAVSRAIAEGFLPNGITGPANQDSLMPAVRLNPPAPRPIVPRFFAGETIRIVPTSQKIMVFSFDDGPDKRHEREISNVFKIRGYEGKPLWLFVAINALSNPDVVRERFDAGEEIGNHTWDHADYSVAGEARQIERAQDALYSITGEAPIYFRGAGGTMGAAITQELARLGLAYIWTTGDEQDYISPRVSPAVMNGLLSRYLQPGYISLRHSGGTHDNTVAAMHDAITIVENAGYTIVSMSEALSMREDGVSALTVPNIFTRLNNWLPHLYDGADGPIGYDLAADIARVK